MSPLFLQTSLWYELQYSSINLELDGKTLEELNKRGMLLKTKRRDMENYSQKNTLKFKDEIYFLCFFLSLSLSRSIPLPFPPRCISLLIGKQLLQQHFQAKCPNRIRNGTLW